VNSVYGGNFDIKTKDGVFSEELEETLGTLHDCLTSNTDVYSVDILVTRGAGIKMLIGVYAVDPAQAECRITNALNRAFSDSGLDATYLLAAPTRQMSLVSA